VRSGPRPPTPCSAVAATFSVRSAVRGKAATFARYASRSPSPNVVAPGSRGTLTAAGAASMACSIWPSAGGTIWAPVSS